MEYLRFSMIWSLAILAVLATETTALEGDLESYGLIQRIRNALLSKNNPEISALLARIKAVEDLQHAVKDSVLDDQYKPWGAASLPHPNDNPGNQVILDKVDDDLFTPNSEVHTYDQQRFH